MGVWMRSRVEIVVCEHCGFREKVQRRETWPAACVRCYHRAAPSWWFRENNPDRVTVEKKVDGRL